MASEIKLITFVSFRPPFDNSSSEAWQVSSSGKINNRRIVYQYKLNMHLSFRLRLVYNMLSIHVMSNIAKK